MKVKTKSYTTHQSARKTGSNKNRNNQLKLLWKVLVSQSQRSGGLKIQKYKVAPVCVKLYVGQCVFVAQSICTYVQLFVGDSLQLEPRGHAEV